MHGGYIPDDYADDIDTWKGTVNQDGRAEPAVERVEDEDDEADPNYECTHCENETHIEDYQKRVQAWCKAECEQLRWHKLLDESE